MVTFAINRNLIIMLTVIINVQIGKYVSQILIHEIGRPHKTLADTGPDPDTETFNSGLRH